MAILLNPMGLQTTHMRWLYATLKFAERVSKVLLPTAFDPKQTFATVTN